jgi:kynurenine formamidase
MMKWKTFAIGWCLALALLLFAQHKSAMSDSKLKPAVFDLTHALHSGSPNWEGTEESPFRASATETHENDGFYTRTFTTAEHYGTHLDAPAHNAPGMWTVEQIPAERLARPLVVLNVRAKALVNPDYEIGVEDIAAWESEHGEIPGGAVVIAYTGWEEFWSSPKQFRNVASDGRMHFPGYSLEAAKFLVQTRSIVGLGIDTLSVDTGAATTFPVHQFTSRQSVYHLENVAGLAYVPASGATVVVAPLKLSDGSGAPVRLLALVK